MQSKRFMPNSIYNKIPFIFPEPLGEEPKKSPKSVNLKKTNSSSAFIRKKP
jgi:hypothetical protein